MTLVAIEYILVAANHALAPIEEVAALGAVALAACTKVALEGLLARHRLLRELAPPARQQRRHQSLLRGGHARVAFNTKLSGSESCSGSTCGSVGSARGCLGVCRLGSGAHRRL
eukprot:3003786-Prymnesium_polylepis.1